MLDTRDLADAAVIDSLKHIKKLGQDQYDSYVSERLVNQTKPITDPIQLDSSMREIQVQTTTCIPEK